jgi:hypothetical protein
MVRRSFFGFVCNGRVGKVLVSDLRPCVRRFRREKYKYIQRGLSEIEMNFWIASDASNG